MRNHMVILLLLVASVAMADTPSTQPAEQYPALMKRMLLLEKENEAMKAIVRNLQIENASLKEKVASLTPKPVLAGMQGGISVGMGRSDVIKHMHGGQSLESQNESGSTYSYIGEQNGQTMIFHCTFDEHDVLRSFYVTAPLN